MFKNSILLVMQTNDLLNTLAKSFVNDGKYLPLPDDITHALVFDTPDRAVEFAVPYTYTQGIAEGDEVCRMKSSQCFVGDYDGIAGVCEKKQQYPYRVIELRPKTTPVKPIVVKENDHEQ